MNTPRYNIHTHTSQDGFTLVETLVAVFVIFVGLTAAFTAAQTSLQASIRARDEVTAFYLAQEGFELIKNTRDTNTQRGDAWYAGFASCTNDTPCEVDITPNSMTQCADDNDACGRMYINNGTYELTGSTPTRFRRFFTTSANGSDNEIQVDMTVEWNQARDTHSFTATEFITYWRR